MYIGQFEQYLFKHVFTVDIARQQFIENMNYVVQFQKKTCEGQHIFVQKG